MITALHNEIARVNRNHPEDLVTGYSIDLEAGTMHIINSTTNYGNCNKLALRGLANHLKNEYNLHVTFSNMGFCYED